MEDYVIPTMQAGADYEGYLLGTSFARPILAKRVVEIARAEAHHIPLKISRETNYSDIVNIS